MTPQEIRKAVGDLKRTIGPKADVSIFASDTHVFGTIYPNGICQTPGLRVDGAEISFAELLLAMEAEWEKHKANHEAETIRKMGLEIIRVTADLGECTDASLRAVFDPSEVDRLGADACAMANEMAANGPFKIVPLAGANAA